MKYAKSILNGYSKPTANLIANALHIPVHAKSKGGGKKMKIPMSVLKDDKKSKKKSGGKMKMSMLKDKEDKGEKNFKKKGEDE